MFMVLAGLFHFVTPCRRLLDSAYPTPDFLSAPGFRFNSINCSITGATLLPWKIDFVERDLNKSYVKEDIGSIVIEPQTVWRP